MYSQYILAILSMYPDVQAGINTCDWICENRSNCVNLIIHNLLSKQSTYLKFGHIVDLPYNCLPMTIGQLV